MSDGFCICEPKYESFDANFQRLGDVDGDIDCQPIVYDRCGSNNQRTVTGSCVSEEEECRNTCAKGSGTFQPRLGLCDCDEVKDLDDICDENCRNIVEKVQIDPTGLLLVKDGETGQVIHVNPNSIDGLFGSISCEPGQQCNVQSLSIGEEGFNGIYGLSPSLTGPVSQQQRRVLGQILNLDEDAIPIILDSARSLYLQNNLKNNNEFDHVKSTKARQIMSLPEQRKQHMQVLQRFAQLWRQSSDKSIPSESAQAFGSIFNDSQSFLGHFYNVSADNLFHHTFARRLSEQPRAVVNRPIVCLSLGDTILFDLSSGPQYYPVYVKDSLLNTNPDFDYGSFRRLATRLTANTTIRSFAFAFREPGIYTFMLAKNPSQLTIISVLREGSRCQSSGAVMPMTSGNLIAVGVIKNDDIILTPNWGLIFGLLGGLMFAVMGVIGGLYYFRSRSWGSPKPAKPKYRSAAKKESLIQEHSKGSIVKKRNVIHPESLTPGDVESGMDLTGEKGKTKKRGSFLGALVGSGSGEYDSDDLGWDRWDLSDLDLRELVERLELHHQRVTEQFSSQSQQLSNLLSLVSTENDQIKRLLLSKLGTANMVAKKRMIEEDFASRALFDRRMGKLEEDYFSMLSALRAQLGSEVGELSSHVAEELMDNALALEKKRNERNRRARGVGFDQEDNESDDELNREDLSELLKQIRSKTTNTIDAARRVKLTCESEMQRRKKASTGLEEEETIMSVLMMDQEFKVRWERLSGLLDQYLATAESFPSMSRDAETSFLDRLSDVREQQNPALESSLRSAFTSQLASVLESLKNAVLQAMGEFPSVVRQLQELRKDARTARNDAQNEFDQNMLKHAEQHGTEDGLDLQELQQAAEGGLAALLQYIVDQVQERGLTVNQTMMASPSTNYIMSTPGTYHPMFGSPISPGMPGYPTNFEMGTGNQHNIPPLLLGMQNSIMQDEHVKVDPIGGGQGEQPQILSLENDIEEVKAAEEVKFLNIELEQEKQKILEETKTRVEKKKQEFEEMFQGVDEEEMVRILKEYESTQAKLAGVLDLERERQTEEMKQRLAERKFRRERKKLKKEDEQAQRLILEKHDREIRELEEKLVNEAKEQEELLQKEEIAELAQEEQQLNVETQVKIDQTKKMMEQKYEEEKKKIEQKKSGEDLEAELHRLREEHLNDVSR